jgi:hypothetical protein
MGIAGCGKMTIGEAIVKQNPNFKLATPDSTLDPILKLLGDDEQVWWSLDEKGWAAVNQALDVALYTIAEVCPKESNFVITSEMLADIQPDIIKRTCLLTKRLYVSLNVFRIFLYPFKYFRQCVHNFIFIIKISIMRTNFTSVFP